MVLLNLTVVASLLVITVHRFLGEFREVLDNGQALDWATRWESLSFWQQYLGDDFDYFVAFGFIPLIMLLLLQIPAYLFLVRPLRRLDQRVARIRAGDLTEPLAPILGPKEIVELNEGVETMRASLQRLTESLTAEVKARTAELAERNAQLDLTLANMARGVILYEPNGDVTVCNRKLLEMFDFPEESCRPGSNIRELIERIAERYARPPDMTDRDLVRLLKGLGAGSVQEFTLPLRNGRTIHVIYKPIENGGFIHTCDDITERLNYEKVLQESRDDAEKANAVKSQFLANMSHELRTPLNAIIGFSELILGGSVGKIDNPKIRDYLEDLHQCGRHLLSLVNDTLDLSKAEAGRLEIEWQSVDAGRAAQDCVRIMSETARKQGVELVCEVEPNLPAIWSNTRRLRQILLNLLSNAIKFTMEGGRVTVKAGMLESGDIELTIVDTGIGMTEREMEKAFNEFQQIESSLSRQYQGTGLGLSLTKRLVELLFGQMAVESVPGRGTTLRVRFSASNFPMVDAQRKATG